MKTPKRQDLGKHGEEFLVVVQPDPLVVAPIITRPRDTPAHRTDVTINEAEMFCLRKPLGDLLIRLSECKRLDPKKFHTIGKISRASVTRIDQAIQRERHNQMNEKRR